MNPRHSGGVVNWANRSFSMCYWQPPPHEHNLACFKKQLTQNPDLKLVWGVVSKLGQNCTIAIASDFHVDEAKSPEISQKEGLLGSEIATRNRKSLATFHRTLKSQCKVSEIASDFWGPRWASQSQIEKIAAISVR